jgi:hypothetical protein
VHPVEGNKCLATLPLHHLECAPGVTNSVACEAASHAIGNAALESLEGGVLPLGAINRRRGRRQCSISASILRMSAGSF